MKLSCDIISDAAKKITFDRTKSFIDNGKDGEMPSGRLIMLIIATDKVCACKISKALGLEEGAEAKEVTKDQFVDASRKAINMMAEETKVGGLADIITDIESTTFCADLIVELYGGEDKDETAKTEA